MNTITPQHLIADARYEVIPMKNVEPQIPHLPAGCTVSVTCSPAKGLQATLDLTARLAGLGYQAVPHFSARLVADAAEVRRLAAVLSHPRAHRGVPRRRRSARAGG